MFPFNFEAQYFKSLDEHSAELTVASKVEFYEGFDSLTSTEGI